MVKLIVFEFKKMFTDKAAKYIFAILCGMLVYNIYTGINRYIFYDSTKEIHDILLPNTGIKAIHAVKEKFYNYETEFNAENLKKLYMDKLKILEEFKKDAKKNNYRPLRYHIEQEKNYVKLRSIYPHDMIIYELAINENNINDSKRINEAIPDDFYEKQIDLRAYNWNITRKKDMDLVKTILQTFRTPYTYKYCEGWKLISNRFYLFQRFLPLLLFMLFILILKYENESDMSGIIFAAKYGKTKFVYARLSAVMLFITFVYSIMCIAYILINLSIFGFKGWDVNIKTSRIFIDTIYNINFLQCISLQFIIGLVLSIFIAFLGFFLFAYFQNYLIALTVSGGFYYLPRFLGQNQFIGSDLIHSINSYVNILGINALRHEIHFCGRLTNGDFIYLFGIPVLRVYASIILYIAGCLLLSVLIIIKYRRIEVLDGHSIPLNLKMKWEKLNEKIGKFVNKI